MFNFYDSSYYLVTGLFAAIFGMAFPLVLQCIQRIDEKYGSSVVSQEFEHEWTFNAFKWLLFPYIIIVCLSPWMLGYLKENSNYSYIIQSFLLLYILAIALVLILLFSRITEYYNIEKLLNSIKIKSPSKDVLISFDLAKYASRKGYQENYFDAMYKVTKCFELERTNTEEGKAVEYSRNLKRVLREIGKTAGNSNSDESLRAFNDILSKLYDMTGKTFVSDSTYNILWYMLNNAAKQGNNNWIKDYWTWTSQHYRFHSKNGSNEFSEKFYRFNIMVGALLVFNKRYECLYHITTYSQSTIDSFVLIPGSLEIILDVGEKLDELLNHPMYLESNFGMLELDRGVDTDSAIIVQAYKYLALLIIRIWSYRDYNYTYSYPLTIPEGHLISADSNENRIRILEILKIHVITWLNSDVFNDIHYSNIPKEEEVTKILDSCIEKCRMMITKINESSGYDEVKLKHIIDEAIIVNSNYFKVIPGINDLPTKESSISKEIFLFRIDSVERQFLQRGKVAECGGIGNFLAISLNLEFKQNYMKKFYEVFNVEEIKVERSKVQELLDSLNLTEKQVIIDLTSGVKINNTAVSFTFGKIWTAEVLFICDKNDLPSCDIIEMNDHPEYQIIDNHNYLYVNVEETKDTFNVSLAQKYKFVACKDKKEAKMIIIKN